MFHLPHFATPASLLVLVLIYAVAAVFSGLSGFGFSAIGCLSLLILPPQIGIALLMVLSLVTQASNLDSLWPELRRHALPWSRPDGVMPYLSGATVGMPAGLVILMSLDARDLTLALGALLISYSVWSLFKPSCLQLPNPAPARLRSFLVGAAGGVVGGFSAFPGSALVIWNGISGIGKERARALTQPFILWMQLVGLSLVIATRPRLFDALFWVTFAGAVPAALLGNALGVAIYRTTGDLGYRRITFAALGLSGFGLVFKVMLT